MDNITLPSLNFEEAKIIIEEHIGDDLNQLMRILCTCDLQRAILFLHQLQQKLK